MSQVIHILLGRLESDRRGKESDACRHREDAKFAEGMAKAFEKAHLLLSSFNLDERKDKNPKEFIAALKQEEEKAKKKKQSFEDGDAEKWSYYSGLAFGLRQAIRTSDRFF